MGLILLRCCILGSRKPCRNVPDELLAVLLGSAPGGCNRQAYGGRCIIQPC